MALRLLRLAVIASIVASLLGGLLYAFYEAVYRSSAGLSIHTLPLFLVFVLMAAASGLLLVFPSLLLVGIPLTWPVRRLIVAYPAASALLYAAIGAAAGRLIIMWLNRDVVFGDREIPPAMIFGATAAATWILTLWTSRGRLGDRSDTSNAS
jgi:hypothetical protein